MSTEDETGSQQVGAEPEYRGLKRRGPKGPQEDAPNDAGFKDMGAFGGPDQRGLGRIMGTKA